MISEAELRSFANDPFNEIRVGECEKNALKVFKKYGGLIFEGYVSYIGTSNEVITIEHYWNVVKSNAVNSSHQTIDIANYLNDSWVIYSNHRGAECSVAYIEGLEKQREVDRKSREEQERRVAASGHKI